jgi:hypothetical protein
MEVNLEDFFETDSLSKLKFVNFEKVLKLSDGDFLEYYNQMMNTYQDFWEKRGHVVCDNCHEDISGPKDLVRYMGANVHRGECIKNLFEKEKYWGRSIVKKYFQRVVDITNPAEKDFQ